jgi:hypothetical protein
VLDAKALKTDRKGLAFLRSVLRSEHGVEAKDALKSSDPPSGKPATPANRTVSR